MKNKDADWREFNPYLLSTLKKHNFITVNGNKYVFYYKNLNQVCIIIYNNEVLDSSFNFREARSTCRWHASINQ